jgi:clathrin heavy chain
VSTTVKAVIQAELPNELIELRDLQNLLILTAIKADKTRVMDYINRLDSHDGPEIAKSALGDPYHLYEEAFPIYKKCSRNSVAMDTLLTNNELLERAQDFAARCNEPTGWGSSANPAQEQLDPRRLRLIPKFGEPDRL